MSERIIARRRWVKYPEGVVPRTLDPDMMGPAERFVTMARATTLEHMLPGLVMTQPCDESPVFEAEIEIDVTDCPEVAALRAERDAAEALVGEVVDLWREDMGTDADCRFDHHGGCQAHGYLSLNPGEQCPVGALLKRVDTLRCMWSFAKGQP